MYHSYHCKERILCRRCREECRPTSTLAHRYTSAVRLWGRRWAPNERQACNECNPLHLVHCILDTSNGKDPRNLFRKNRLHKWGSKFCRQLCWLGWLSNTRIWLSTRRERSFYYSQWGSHPILWQHGHWALQNPYPEASLTKLIFAWCNRLALFLLPLCSFHLFVRRKCFQKESEGHILGRQFECKLMLCPANFLVRKWLKGSATKNCSSSRLSGQSHKIRPWNEFRAGYPTY